MSDAVRSAADPRVARGYRDAWIAFRKDNVVRLVGKPGTHSVVTIKPGVTVFAVDDDRNTYLTEEFH